MLYYGVYTITQLCFHKITKLTLGIEMGGRRRWRVKVETISFGTLSEQAFGKVSQQSCPRLTVDNTKTRYIILRQFN